MILRLPSYYKEFHCIASECSDSCCIGWEIDLDDDSAAYYESVEGPMGDFMRKHMKDQKFTLRKNGWCPMLNEHKLCRIYIELGEEALSEVCTEYPRFVIDYPGVRERVLCLSCEEVGRIVFRKTEKMHWEEKTLPEEYEDTEWTDEEWELAGKLIAARDHAVELLQDRERAIEDRAADYLAYIAKTQQEIFHTVPKEETASEKTPYQCFKERLLCYEELEGLGQEWEQAKKQLEQVYSEEQYETRLQEFLEALGERKYEYEHLLVYFTYRYFMRAFYDENLLAKAQFAVTGFLLVREMDAARFFTNGAFTEADRVDTARIYAKEVEHSEENVELLEDDFLFEDVFTVPELMKQILCTRPADQKMM